MCRMMKEVGVSLVAVIALLLMCNTNVTHAANVYGYSCAWCGEAVVRTSQPSNNGCPAQGRHFWTMVTQGNLTRWECNWCPKSTFTNGGLPSKFGCSSASHKHFWKNVGR